MKRQNPSNAVLGIFVKATTIEGALLAPAGKRYEVVATLSRKRMKTGEKTWTGSLAPILPGLREGDEGDFTIQVGDGGSPSDMFLSGEFVGLANDLDLEDMGSGSANQHNALPFGQPLREMLAECENLGYEKPTLAFCIGAPDVTYVDLFVSRDHIEASRKKWSLPLKKGPEQGVPHVDRKRLLDLLNTQHTALFDADRVAFVPMTPLIGQHRYLAIVPEANDPVTATLNAVYRQRATVPSSRVLGTEVSLYTALTREALAPTDLENTAVVRIGSEDTLILFLSGTGLRHLERLRSLTTYDPPETICSRVLLQQDEQKIGEIHRIQVLADGHSELFVDAFRKFYPNAAVEPLDEVVARRHLVLSDPQPKLRTTAIPAIGIGLNVLQGWEKDDPFGAVNLLPKKLRQKPRQKLAYAWHTFLMLLCLFGVTFYFTWQYAERQAELERNRAELQLLNIPDPMMGTSAALQTRVDSLQGVYQKYTLALQVLDSLLIGSDQWTRTLEMTSRATRELPGVWFESWHPMGASIQLKGHAKSRESIARLAYLLNGAIHETSFVDINDARLHSFTVLVPRPVGKPMVADYLKEAVTAAEAERAARAPQENPAATDTPVHQENP